MLISRPVVCKFHGTDRRKSLNTSGYGDRKVETRTRSIILVVVLTRLLAFIITFLAIHKVLYAALVQCCLLEVTISRENTKSCCKRSARWCHGPFWRTNAAFNAANEKMDTPLRGFFDPACTMSLLETGYLIAFKCWHAYCDNALPIDRSFSASSQRGTGCRVISYPDTLFLPFLP